MLNHLSIVIRQPFVVAFLSASLLTGCGIELPFLIAATGIGVGTAIAVDRRPAATQMDDIKIESSAGSWVKQHYPAAHININSFNHVVLITGEAPDVATRQALERGVQSIENVRQVFNQVVIAPPSTTSERAHDAWITTKVKAAFATDKNINGRDISVVTEAGVVFLMGIVTASESQKAREYASTNISGVKKVVTLFEIASPESLK